MTEFVSNKDFEKKFNQLLKDSIEVAIGSAFINIDGLNLLTDYLEKVGKLVKKKIRFLLSDKFHEKKDIRKKILEKLKSIPNVEVKIYSKEEYRFHAKIFIFSSEEIVNILTGSYNMTGAGMNSNIEAGYLIKGQKQDQAIKDAITFFEENWNTSMNYKEYMHRESMTPEPKFKKGDQVYVIAKPEKNGIIQSDPIQLKGTFLYTVYFSITDKSNYKEDQLQLVKKDEDNNIIELLSKNMLESAAHFLQAYTLIKLNNPLTDNIYAFLSSRTEFNAYQFKPVLKFLNSPFQRLLIADEVGVGKTIEAGIIYTELKARKELERVLIVCPNALMPKWKDEMKSRFDENFEILSSERLRYVINEVMKGIDITNFRGICSLQLLRMEGYLQKLQELRLSFDLVIVDEAHHMRNRGQSYDLGMYLSINSDAMIFLTATPLQLGNQDFFNLMHLLLPEEFRNFYYFEKLIEPNQYLNATYALLKNKNYSQKDALEILQKIDSCEMGDKLSKNPDYIHIKKLLSSINRPTFDETIYIQNKLNQFNPLSNVYTRTRKRDVMNSAKREPHLVHVIYSSEEMEFYNRVIDYARYKFKKRNMGNLQGVGFSTIMVQRQVASCIPAMISYLKDLLKSKEKVTITEDDDYIADDSDIDLDEKTEKLDDTEIKFIKEILNVGERIGDRDQKFDGFIKTLDLLLEQSGVNGIMVFSFFRKTLEYLREKLRRKGYKIGLIYGGIDLDERERITEQLRAGEIQILLSSEVGGEGLDFQFCNCMFNYDLPWNPMRVEQRIGRLDRYGQLSPKILIYNFSVENTIETRIFGRLYERIQIFERYIGELEGILGKEISDLTKLVISTKLSPEEEQEKIEEIQRVIEKKKIELKEFEKVRSKFVGQDDYFTEQINNIQKTKRFISSEEIKNFVFLFLNEYYPKSKLIQKENEIYTLKSGSELLSFLKKEKISLPQNKRSELLVFIRKLESTDIDLTFDNKQACTSKRIEFITLRHPFIKCIISFLQNNGTLNPVGNIVMANEEHKGDYLFFTYIINVNAAKTLLEMHTVVVNIDNFEINEYLSENFGTLIFDFTDTKSDKSTSREIIRLCQQKALEHISTIQDKKEEEIKQSNDFLINAQIESQTAFFNYKIGQAKKILNESTNDNIIRMKTSEIEGLREELRKKINDLEKRRCIDISFNLVAGGIMQVKSKEG